MTKNYMHMRLHAIHLELFLMHCINSENEKSAKDFTKISFSFQNTKKNNSTLMIPDFEDMFSRKDLKDMKQLFEDEESQWSF